MSCVWALQQVCRCRRQHRSYIHTGGATITIRQAEINSLRSLSIDQLIWLSDMPRDPWRTLAVIELLFGRVWVWQWANTYTHHYCKPNVHNSGPLLEDRCHYSGPSCCYLLLQEREIHTANPVGRLLLPVLIMSCKACDCGCLFESPEGDQHSACPLRCVIGETSV